MNILIADDDATNRLILRRFLEKWGYQVTATENGAQAWEAMQAAQVPGIALLDWMMPEMDGIEICRRLRAQSGAPYIYVILLTAKSQKQDILAGFAAGADDYLSKPFDTDELAARVRAGLRVVELHAELLQSRQKLQEMVSRDATTGLWSRAAIFDLIDSELSLSRREGMPFGILLADIDHFKVVNDQYGHLIGDEVLLEVGNRISRCLRRHDAAGRYGGEEFLILTRPGKAEGLLSLGERIRAEIAATPMQTSRGPISITLSLGFTICPGSHPTDRRLLIDEADSALYRAKHTGRNRVVDFRACQPETESAIA